MSIAKALSNAVSGLTATARGTETVASNLANIMTPGYARREMVVSAQAMGGVGGGVRIDGITRVVNAGLMAEMRSAGSAKAETAARLKFLKAAEDLVGLPGNAGSLGAALSGFQSALLQAGARPDDDIRLANVLTSAQKLASGLNNASSTVQAMRSEADHAIARDVDALNASLERVAYLNKRISIISARGNDPSALMDERQGVIDKISAIVPVQEIAREYGKVALFTAEGATLLDGSTPTQFSFVEMPQITPGQTPDSSPMSRLIVNGTELSASQMRLFAGGSMQGQFAVRDQLAPQLQHELDTLALDLHDRLASTAVDPTIGTGGVGFFTDAGSRADIASTVGLAGRLSVNAALDPASGGELWRIRSGTGTTTAGPTGDTAQLNRLTAALDRSLAAPATGALPGSATFSQRIAALESQASTRRVSVEADSTIRNSRYETISGRFLADGVDSDAEMRKLLEYEQAYAANARVIQAVEEMIDQILRL